MILIGIATLMLVFGIMMQRGKGNFLISGYNTLSKEQQAQVDIQALSRFMAFYMYFLAAILLLMALFEWLNWPNGIIVCVVILLLSTVAVLWKSQTFYANVTATKGRWLRGGSKWSVAISLVTVIGVGALLYMAMQPTAIAVGEDELTIGGMYGETFALSELAEVELVDVLPAISMRTNGSAVGSKLQGHFKLESGEKVKLFVDKKTPPFITFVADGKRFYMNATSAEETEAIYQQMTNE